MRVGKTNQVMSPAEQQARLQSAESRWSEERDRPTFEFTGSSITNTESSFEPSWRLKQASGDYVPNLDWRFRGPRFQMDWRPASGETLGRRNLSGVFDLSAPPQSDDLVQEDEMAVEIRFHWRGSWRHEIHRWPIARRVIGAAAQKKVHWDVGRERIPPLRFDS